MWIRTAATAALLTALVSAAPAQGPKLPGFIASVKTEVAPTALKPGAKATVKVTIEMARGYHIYATDPGDEFAVATELTPLAVKGITYGKAVWPKPTMHEKARIHEGTITVSIPVTVAKTVKPGAVKLGASIKAQGCNESSCLPPDTFQAVASAVIGK